jgi:hypothetical protein
MSGVAIKVSPMPDIAMSRIFIEARFELTEKVKIQAQAQLETYQELRQWTGRQW